MIKRVCVIDLPGLSRQLLQHVPAGSALGKWMQDKSVADLIPPWPAVTCPVQATLTTGVSPSQHGIVANGIATFRSAEDQALVDASNFASYRREVSFWEQSNQLLEAPRFWQDDAGKSRWKTALLFFQNSMPGFSGAPTPAADIVITPKPEHGADGKITSLLWTEPEDLVPRLFEQFGAFPLMSYWGPLAGIASSRWIARAAAWVWNEHQPQLQLTYIPHLDYDLQRFGPHSERARKAVADVSMALEPLLDVLPSDDLIILSEYSMHPVDTSIQPNRILADAGLLVTRQTSEGMRIDYGRSQACAMVDHQIAHVYIRVKESRHAVLEALRHKPLREVDPSVQISHHRAGDLQLEAAPTAWFDYRWWSQSEDAPGFAPTVDIHRKPGYDPLELFFDPATNAISQDATRVRGSHGATVTSQGILVASGAPDGVRFSATDFAGLIRRRLC